MQTTKTINAPKSANYLSDIKNFEIPVNAIFNKGKTGCGGTELAINQKGNAIIAMPYVNLVKNKEIWNERRKHNILGVYGEVTNKDIKEYANNNETIKICVTYDSLNRVIETLSNLGYNVYGDFFLLVDEYHALFTSYSFRHKAITKLLSLATNFNNVTYMSATPIERKYILDELEHLPTVEIKWENAIAITVQSRPQRKPIDYVSHICRNTIDNNIKGNLHFFVNSVEFISKVIKKANLTPDMVKVVCSNSGDSASKNTQKLGKNYPIQIPSDTVKKFNFYTSTAFEGCDIYDEIGRTIIISDSNKAQTLLDISTQFPQICGRLRNSIYNREVMHIFSTTRYSGDVTLEEFIASTNITLLEAQKFATDINNVPDDSRNTILSKILYINEKYVRIEENRLIVDKNLANIDIVNFKITKQIYKTVITLSDEMQKYDFGINIKCMTYETPSEIIEINPNARVAFQELFNEYADMREKPISYDLNLPHYRLGIIESANPLIKDAYEKLGRKEVANLKWARCKITFPQRAQIMICFQNAPPQKKAIKFKLLSLYPSLCAVLWDWLKILLKKSDK